MRQLAFSPIESNFQKSENTVSLKDLRFELQASENTGEFPSDAHQIFEGRLKERLMEKNLAIVYHDDAAYKLSGNIVVKEDSGMNALIVPGFIVGVGLFPVGLFIMSAMPTQDLHDTVNADIVLTENGSNEVLLQESYSKEFDGSINGYQARLTPDSKLNYTLTSLSDDVFQELSSAVADKINAH